MDHRNRSLNQLSGILAGGITALVACALASLFSIRERIKLFLRDTSHGGNVVSSAAVNGMPSIADDSVPQLVSSSPIMTALARVPGYVLSFPSIWNITPGHPPGNVTPLHIMNISNTFLIVINSSVDRRYWSDELQRSLAENNIVTALCYGGYRTLTFRAVPSVYIIDHKLQKEVR